MKAQQYGHKRQIADLSDAELLALQLGCTFKSAILKLKEQGSLRNVLNDHEHLLSLRHRERAQVALETNRRYLRERLEAGPVMDNPDAIRAFLSANLRDCQSEQFAVMFLTARHNLISFDVLFKGTINGASVYPREVVRAAIKHNAAACVLAHNHPSGNGEPSQSDERITRRLQEALTLIDVRVLDHFVVGENIASFAERGLI